jgi:hypothetical protein
MKKFIFFIISFTAAAAVSCSTAKKVDHASISFMIGDVKINNVSAEIGTPIKESDSIITEQGAFCDIKIGGSIIRIKEKSKVLFASLMNSKNIENTTLGLESGKLLCKPKKLLKSENFMVKTPTAVAGVRGTQFSVEADTAQTTRIKVFDGNVKVVKRVKQFEDIEAKVLENAVEITEKEKVVITKEEVDKAEKAVDEILKKETAAGTEEALLAAVGKSAGVVGIKEGSVETFAAADFIRENNEMIDVKEKPAEVIRQLAKVVNIDKEKPVAEGRVVITRDEVYFIKEGNIVWQSRLTGEPVRKDDKLYLATDDNVFCVSKEGPVVWQKNLINDGKVELKNDILSIFVKGREVLIDPETGGKM